MLLALAAVVLVIWAIVFFFANLGVLIHLVLVVAVVLLILHFVRGRGRSRV